MRSFLLDLLICPSCLPAEIPFIARVYKQTPEDIIEADLYCKRCENIYPVRSGVARLLPHKQDKTSKISEKYETETILSSYLWAHYGDLWGDELATDAYRIWSELVSSSSGLCIDAGCAVGRLSFEVCSKCEQVVGVDASEKFIQTARSLMLGREIHVSVPIEGHICEERIFRLPDSWQCSGLDFIVADVEALPFASGVASVFVSLNLLDKVPYPLRHISEMDRITKLDGAQCVFSDPFSWSEEIARPQDWLGGTREGPFSGRGLDNLQRILNGEDEIVQVPWTVEKRGSIWWKLRNHENHFELIRSCYIKARR